MEEAHAHYPRKTQKRHIRSLKKKKAKNFISFK
jgi:hypothetical protein